MAAGECEIGSLGGAVGFVGMARGHVEGLVDFKAPGGTLDGFVRGHFGKVAVGWLGIVNNTVLFYYAKSGQDY